MKLVTLKIGEDYKCYYVWMIEKNLRNENDKIIGNDWDIINSGVV